MNQKTNSQSNFNQQRRQMVKQQLKKRGIDHALVLKAFQNVPREKFVNPSHQHLAYADTALPLTAGQTISQPYIVAKMCQLLQPEPDQKILEIGTGAGYQAAILSQMVKQVITIEIVPELAQRARQNFKQLGYKNIKVVKGDGKQGYPDQAPFDGIIAAAACTHIPQAWKNQLKKKGRIVAPLQQDGRQQLMVLTKQNQQWQQQPADRVVFVPLV